MRENKNNQEINTIEDIAAEDWPLLKELEETRFSLKKKRDKQDPTALWNNIRDVSAVENQSFSNKNVADESRFDAFFDKEGESSSKDENSSFGKIVVGMIDLYMRGTDKLLDPLRFLFKNKNLVLVALSQFVVPALMVVFLASNFELIATQFEHDSLGLKVLQFTIFYFACMFVWITIEVIFGGLFNVLKKTISEISSGK